MKLSDLPDGECHGVVLHWSAGRYLTTFDHYHVCVLGPPRDGEQVISQPFVHNLRQIEPGMTYAAHTRRRNSFMLGFSAMAMYGGTTNDYGAYPPTKKQIESLCAVAALAVVKYQLTIEAQVRTHYEWAVQDGYFPNRWDWMKETTMLRRKIAWYAKRV